VSTIFCFKGVAVYLEALNGPPCFPARVFKRSSGAFTGLLITAGLRADCARRIDLDQDFCEIPHRNPDVVRGPTTCVCDSLRTRNCVNARMSHAQFVCLRPSRTSVGATAGSVHAELEAPEHRIGPVRSAIFMNLKQWRSVLGSAICVTTLSACSQADDNAPSKHDANFQPADLR
jgi:hypothetical protein